MEKPSTFDRAFWIMWISWIYQMISVEIIAFVNPFAAKYHPYTIKYYIFVIAIFLFITWFSFQIKKAKDWARFLHLIFNLFYIFLVLYFYWMFFQNFRGISKMTSIEVYKTFYPILSWSLSLYASLIVFSKKSTEYINYKYHLKQDLKRREKENNSSKYL